MKSRMKYEIALAAGMSTSTLCRWMKRHREELRAVGVTPGQRLLHPRAVQFVCDELDIMEEDFG